MPRAAKRKSAEPPPPPPPPLNLAAGERWPADLVERWPVEKLLPYARNERLHSEEHVGSSSPPPESSAGPCRSWLTAGVLIARHGRVLAAKKLGIVDIPIIVVSGWSE